MNHDDASRQLSRRHAIRLLGFGSSLGLAAGTRAIAAPAQRAVAGQKAGIPKGAIIRTLLKDVPPDRLGTGAALIHEHVTAGNDVNVLVDEVRASGHEGVSCLVDAATGKRRPGALDDLRTIATRSGVHIIAAGGYFKTPYPPEVAQKNEDAIADELAQDATAERWGAFGEIGTSMEMQPEERKVLRAVSKAHLRTGVPIFTHTEHQGWASCGLAQLALFEWQGV